MAGSHLACLDACSPDTQQLAGLSSCSAPTAAAAACGSTAAIKSTSETATPEPAAPALAAPPASAVRAAPAAAVTSSRSSKKIKQDLAGPCCHCGAVSSPQWRKGPKGKPVLCNACGIRFLRNRTLTKVMVSYRVQSHCCAAVCIHTRIHTHFRKQQEAAANHCRPSALQQRQATDSWHQQCRIASQLERLVVLPVIG